MFSMGLMPKMFDSIRCEANINKTWKNKIKTKKLN